MNSLEDDDDFNEALSVAVGDHLSKQEQHNLARRRSTSLTLDSGTLNTQPPPTSQPYRHISSNIQHQPKPDEYNKKEPDFIQHDTRRVYKKESPKRFKNPAQFQKNEIDLTIENFRYKTSPVKSNLRQDQMNNEEIYQQTENKNWRNLKQNFQGERRRYVSSQSPEKRRISRSPPRYFYKENEIKKPREWDLPKIRPNLNKRARISNSEKRESQQEGSFDSILQQHKRLQIDFPPTYYKPNLQPQTDKKQMNEREHEFQQPQTSTDQTLEPEKCEENLDESIKTVEIDGQHYSLVDIRNALKKAFQHQFTDMVDSNTLEQPEQTIDEPVDQSYEPAGDFVGPNFVPLKPETPMQESLDLQSELIQENAQNVNLNTDEINLMNQGDVVENKNVINQDAIFKENQSPSISERKVEYIPAEDQVHPKFNDGSVQDDIDNELLSDEEEDEELLQLRLLALSSAYSRNVVGPQEQPLDEAESNLLGDEEEIKLIKKKNKRKKIFKKVPQLKKRGRQKPNLSINKLKLNSINNQNRNKKSRTKRPPAILSSDVLTLGAAIRQMKSEQTKQIDLISNQNLTNNKTENEPQHSMVDENLDNYDVVEMDIASPLHGQESSILLPVPPGTEEEKINQTPTQESIWDLLDDPLQITTNNIQENANHSLQDQVFETENIEILKSLTTQQDFEESTKNKNSKILRLENPKLTKERFNYSVPGSPIDYQHAFAPTKLSSGGLDADFMFPTGQHDFVENMEDIDKPEFLVHSTPNTTIEKGFSTDDIDELREHLLKDMLKKRKDDNDFVKPELESKPKLVNKLPKKQGKVSRMRRNKRRSLLQRRNSKSANNSPLSSNKVSHTLHEPETKNLSPKVLEENVKPKNAESSKFAGLLPTPQSIFGLNLPGFPIIPQFPPPAFPFNFPPPVLPNLNQNSQILSSTSKNNISDSLNKNISKNVTENSQPISSVNKSTQKTLNPKTLTTKSSILSRLGPPVVTKQRLLHPQVVIDLVNSSSDEEDFTLNLNQIIKNARAQVQANDNSSKTQLKLSSKESSQQNLQSYEVLFKTGSVSQINNTAQNKTNKTKTATNSTTSPRNENVTPSMTVQSKTTKKIQQEQTTTEDMSTSTEQVVIVKPVPTTTVEKQQKQKETSIDKSTEPETVNQQAQSTATTLKQTTMTATNLKQAQNTTTTDHIESVDIKLLRVRELLQRDKAIISKFQQQKISKSNEIGKFKSEVEMLKLKLEEVENKIKVENMNLFKIDKNLFDSVKKMKQRQKLETRFLNQISNSKKPENLGLKDKSKQVEAMQVVVISSNNKNDDVFVNEDQNKNLKKGEKNSEIKNVKTTAIQIEEQKKLLLEKQRNLERSKTLHQEKLKLKSTEKKLKLIKQNTTSKILKHSKSQQFLSSQKLHKTIHSTPTRQLHSYISTQKLTPLKSNSRNYSATIRKHRNSLSRKNSTSGVRLRTKSQERILLELRKRKLEIEKLKQQKEVAAHSTPSLKKRNRKDSISKIIKTLKYNDDVTKRSMETTEIKSGFSLSNEAMIKLKQKLKQKFLHLSFLTNSTIEQSALLNLHTVPVCLSSWKIDVGELARQSTFPVFKPHDISLNKELDYQSELQNFKSYRLNSFYQTRDKLTVTSATFSNKIDPHKLICRYDLTGKCHDLNCQGQHLSESTLSSNEIYLDLLSYCPALLKTENGKNINKQDSMAVKLKAAESTVKRLCGSVKLSSKDQATNINQTCIMLVGFINRALGNKPPHSTMLTRRDFKITIQGTEQINKNENNVKTNLADWINLDTDEIFSFTENTNRYFNNNNAEISQDSSESDINEFKASLSKHPENVELRIKLANLYLSKASKGSKKEKKNCLDLALNTLCLGIEIDEQNELLWTSYLPLLSFHNIDNNVENLQVVDQCLVLLPFSKSIWTEILKWKWPYQKLQSLYHQLIQSLIMRKQIWSTDDELKVWKDKFNFGYYSQWLLQMLVEQCYFTLVSKDKNEARKILLGHLKSLNDIRKTQQDMLTNKKIITEYPISQQHLSTIWLIYIHLIEYGKLPDTVLDNSLSAQEYGIAIFDKKINLNFSSKFSQKPEKLQSLLKAALLSCNDLALPIEVNTMNCLQLYKALIDLETKLGKWEVVNTTCQRLVSSGCDNENNKQASKIWNIWVKAILQSNDSVMITQMFDKAVTACPKCAKLSYMAAMYQLNSSNIDVEAALLYLETCITAYIDVGDSEGLSIFELHQLYRKLLKHDIGLPSSNKEVVKIRENNLEESFQKEKTYLWLSYCILNDLLIKERKGKKVVAGHEKVATTSELYEAALHNALSVKDRKIIWVEYILYERSTANDTTTRSTKQSTTQSTSTKLSTRFQQTQQQMLWMKYFTSLIKRCLTSIPSKFNKDKQSYVDYSFHNQIASIYLDCFKGQQYCTALALLTEFMPHNLPLLSRAASHFLKEGNYAIVTSLLWGVTSQSSSRLICRQPSLWRVAAAAYAGEEKYWKALGVYKKSLNALSRHRGVWKEIISLALLCGDKVDLEGVNPKFFNIFEETLQSMTDNIIKSLQ